MEYNHIIIDYEIWIKLEKNYPNFYILDIRNKDKAYKNPGHYSNS
jgi:hypothetical protein